MKLLETIRFENGGFDNLTYHQERMNNSRKELFGCDDEIYLFTILQEWLTKATAKSRPSRSRFYGFLNCRQANVMRKLNEAENESRSDLKGLVKCRIIYSDQIEKIEFTPYQIPNIHSLKIIVDNQIDYQYKYYDRSRLEQLLSTKGKYDDILIVKNGLITDTFYTNVLFYDGNVWVTPSQPLLKGTQRESLLQKEIIKTAEIRVADLEKFQKARLINAMIRFEDKLDIEIENISV